MSELTKEDVVSFLESHHLLALATADSSAMPWATVVLYVCDSDANIYFATFPNSKKVHNVQENANVAITIGFDEHNLQAQGVAEFIEDEQEKVRIVDLLSQKAVEHKLWPPLIQINQQSANIDYSVFKFTLKNVRMLDASHKAISIKESPFSEIQLS